MSESGDVSRIIQFNELLQQCGFDVDAESLVDILWLAQYQDRQEWVPPGSIQGNSAGDECEDSGTERGERMPPVPKRKRPNSDFSLRPDDPGLHERGRGGGSGGVSVKAPAAPALRHSWSLGRSLRPLMQKLPSQTNVELDEDATANQIAERRLRIPILRPSPERWLSLILVVEHSKSTVIWKEVIHEFQRLLEHQGAFRDVRTWALHVDEQGTVQLCSKPHIAPDCQRLRTPKELLDPSGRTLLMVVSDCTSFAWQTGVMYDLLKLWVQDNLVTLVQLLPERLWDRSVLGEGIPVPLTSMSRGAKNAQLETMRTARWQQLETPGFLQLPVVTLQPEPLHQWANVIAGQGNCQTPGILMDRPLALEDSSTVATSGLTAESLVKWFSNTASPLAQKLAGLLAAVPITLPVIHLVQETIPSVTQSSQVHVAEIIMSGLLKPIRSQSQGDASPRYDFVKGVRERLIAPPFVTIAEVDQVLEAVSQYIARKVDISIKSFAALLTLRAGDKGADNPEILDFALISKQVLRRLGPEYAALVDALDESSSGVLDLSQYDLEAFTCESIKIIALPSEPTRITTTVTQYVRSALPSPGLEYVEVKRLECVRFVEDIPDESSSSESFETFAIRVAMVEQQNSEWIVTYEETEAQRYIETLPDGIPLELVAIPSGKFIMGSPEDEPERFGDESPQHEVVISYGFLMGRYPVTQAQWRIVESLPQVNQSLNPDPSRFKGDDRPVESINWHDAMEFCHRLNQYFDSRSPDVRDYEYRLPSEAEWEYACRARTTTPFHFGSMITTEVANYDGSSTYADGPSGESPGETTPVTQFNHANRFGLSDMHGNVDEWCLDHWHADYQGAPLNGSAWLEDPLHNNGRVYRGGSWIYHPRYCRSAYRNHSTPDGQDGSLGFRVVLAPRSALPSRQG